MDEGTPKIRRARAVPLSSWQRWAGQLLHALGGNPLYVWMFVDPAPTTKAHRQLTTWKFSLYVWAVVTIEIVATIFILGMGHPLSCTSCWP